MSKEYEFKEALRRAGIQNVPREIMPDGNPHRFSDNGKQNMDGWYILNSVDDVWFGGFGNHKDVHERYSSLKKGQSFTANQKVEWENKQVLINEKMDSQKKVIETNQELVAEKAQKDLDNFAIDGNSCYLTRKKVKAFDVRYGSDLRGRFIVVPMKDADGKLWSYQNIYNDGSKRFLTGGRKKGCFHIIDGLNNATIVYVVEGYSTGASVHMATGMPVVTAFDAGNIASVVEAVQNFYPNLRIAICGDDDQGKDVNTGRKKAEEAADKYGCSVVFPKFKNTESNPTDWNDLHCLEGLEEVKNQLEEHARALANYNSITIHSANLSTLPHGYRVASTGIEYLKENKGAGEEPEKWKWLCSLLKVTALTRDEHGHNWGRIIELVDKDGVKKEFTMPMDYLSGNGDELRKDLLSLGVTMDSSPAGRNQLSAYISSSSPQQRATCVGNVGWFRNYYVLPDKVYGQQDGERVVFQSKGAAPKIIRSGSFSEWQDHIGKYIHDNPILVLVACAALAAPLLHLLTEENFVIHLSGGSSIGKTSAVHVARSICGNEIHSWRTTDNAAESLVRNANDSVVVFDELGEVDGKAADNMSYMLGNGSGKARANKSGDARPITKFRAIILSTGEVGLGSKLAEVGKSQRAGQSVRFIEIQADAGVGYGIYKVLHDFEKGEHLSEHLKQASELYAGAAMDAWLTYLTQSIEIQENVVNLVKALRDEWIYNFVPSSANEQVKRCARKFAFLAATGEVLIFLGILSGYSNEHNQDAPKLGALSESINELFESWIANRGGEGSHELSEIMNSLSSFIDQHGSRFEMPWRDTNHDSEHMDMSTSQTPSDQRIYQRAGYKKLINNQWHYYFYPSVFEKEVLKGKNKRALLKALADKGILKKDNSGKNTHSIHIPCEGQKRLICILLDAANMGDEDE